MRQRWPKNKDKTEISRCVAIEAALGWFKALETE